MNQLQKHFSASLIALAALLSAAPMAMAANASLSNFAILSAAPGQGGAVTLTDSTINGDVGSSGLKASVTNTRSIINGSIIAPVSASVVTNFNTALAAGLALQCSSTISGDLAGQSLIPGVYCVSAASTTTAGTLTLNGTASDTWTFIVGTVGTGALTGTSLNVVLGDGTTPAPCDAITWYVAQAATLTDSTFAGTIYAGAAITITRGTFNGDALAGDAVTTTGTTVNGCTSTKHHSHVACNQGVGNGYEGCDPGNSNNTNTSNDELVNGEYGTPGDPGRQPDNTATPF
jgi:Ice-binding-like